MRKLLLSIFFLCGLSFASVCQIYLPVTPTVYGENANRIRAWIALHIPEKIGLTTNTNDTTSQIFVNKSDGKLYWYYKPLGYTPIVSGSVVQTLDWFNVVIDGGSDNTGVIDASSIIQTAINLGYKTIYFPKGLFKINTTIQMKDSVTIIGDGRSSVIKTTGDTTVFKCSLGKGGNNCKFTNFQIRGNYSYVQGIAGIISNQIGILTDSARGVSIIDIKATAFKGCGIRILRNGYCCATYTWNASMSNTISNCYFDSSYTGADLGNLAEYNTITSSLFSNNYYALTCSGGNNRINNNSIVANEYGLYITQGTNGAHGTATGNEINHNDVCLTVSGVTFGFSFVNNVFGRKIDGGLTVLELINSSNLKFIGGIAVSGDTVRTTGCSAISFIDQAYLAGDYTFVNVSGTAPTVTRTGVVANSISIKDVINSKQVDITHTNGLLGFTQNGSAASIKVGIGTTSPVSNLHTIGTVRHASLGTASIDTTTYKPLSINSAGDIIPLTYWGIISPSQNYPGAGIPNSTGSAWATSYGVSGNGTTVALNNIPTIDSVTLTGLETVTGNMSFGSSNYLTFGSGGTGAGIKRGGSQIIQIVQDDGSTAGDLRMRNFETSGAYGSIGNNVILYANAGNGILRLADYSAGTEFSKLIFGSADATHPSFVISGDSIKVRNGSNTADAKFTAGMSYFTGNVGVGTTSPGAKLDLTSTGNNNLRIAYNGSFYWDIYRDNVDGSLQFKDVSSATPRVTMLTGGSVGIGNTSPSNTLDVTGTFRATGTSTVAAVNASGVMNISPTSTSVTSLLVNAPTSFSGNIFDVQLNGTSKLKVLQSGATFITGLLKSTNYETDNVAGYIGFNGRSSIASSADGTIWISNYNQDNCIGLGLGSGTSASFPFVARSSTNAIICLANQAAGAALGVGMASATGVATSAIGEFASTTKGLLIPRMTTTQMNAISSPATGLSLYNTDAKASYEYNGTNFQSTGIVSGSYNSGAVVAQTTFTVTFGGTQPNSTYHVNVAATSLLGAAVFYVNNKTTTTFDVVYLSGLTGTLTFDYQVAQ